jgi:hypothetical protein
MEDLTIGRVHWEHYQSWRVESQRKQGENAAMGKNDRDEPEGLIPAIQEVARLSMHTGEPF